MYLSIIHLNRATYRRRSGVTVTALEAATGLNVDAELVTLGAGVLVNALAWGVACPGR